MEKINLSDFLISKILEVGEALNTIKDCAIFYRGEFTQNSILCYDSFDANKLDIFNTVDYSSINSVNDYKKKYFGLINFIDGGYLRKEHDQLEWTYFPPHDLDNFILSYNKQYIKNKA